ncbi:XRE family transcriptional regulator, partial [Escherichia coli]|nr:XRE family transcriptional regulator [Escherichia coli]
IIQDAADVLNISADELAPPEK